jgi:RimJ/RimL family protein N-acetyltransferase
MRAQIPFTSARLLLRELSRDDAEAIHSYTSDPEVVRYVDFGPESEAQTIEFIRDVMDMRWDEPRLFFSLAVVLHANGQLIGHCDLHIRDERHGEAEIGYCLHRKSWGQGYATEAVKSLLAFGFRQLKLHRIMAMCDAENHASLRVMAKAGMCEEGYLHKNKWYKGLWHDSMLYAIWQE